MSLTTTLTECHRFLRPDYTETDNATKANCVRIAYDIARQFVRRSQDPRIYEVTPSYAEGYPQPGLTVTTFPSLSFYTHFFTSVENTAYDPLHKNPVSIQSYIEKTFEEDDLSLNLRASAETIKKELNRREHRYIEDQLM